MKISTLVITILMCAAVVAMFTLMLDEAKVKYPNANIDTSEWDNNYSYSEQINDSIAPMQEAFNDIQDENKGWFSKIATGIVAVPLAVINIPILLFKVFGIGGNMVASAFSYFNFPVAILSIFIIAIIVWGVFKLVEIYNRWQI